MEKLTLQGIAAMVNTSIKINENILKIYFDNPEVENKKYINTLKNGGDGWIITADDDPPVKSNFWGMANHKANTWFKSRYKNYPKIRLITQGDSLHYATWFEDSFKQNLSGMNLYEKLNSFK